MGVLLLVGILVLPPGTSAQPLPVDTFQIMFREGETARWGTGAGTQVEDTVQVTRLEGGSPLPMVKLDNQAALGGGLLITCRGSGGTFDVMFDYKNLSGALGRRTDLKLSCLPPFGLQRVPVSQQRTVDFGSGAEVTKVAATPPGGGIIVRLDNTPLRGGFTFSCEGPFEGNLSYQYRFRDPKPLPVTLEGTVIGVCYEF
jgi:hypothetical protein